MDWLIATAAYLVVHAVTYLLVLRRRAAFGRERVIFAYHALSALATSAYVAVAFILQPGAERFAAAVAVVSLHGLYSVSFLELWSLAEGSYSLTILRRIAAGSDPENDPALAAVGLAKHQNRAGGLEGIGLVRRDGERVTLTGRGRAVAAVLALIVWLANIRQAHDAPAGQPPAGPARPGEG